MQEKFLTNPLSIGYSDNSPHLSITIWDSYNFESLFVAGNLLVMKIPPCDNLTPLNSTVFLLCSWECFLCPDSIIDLVAILLRPINSNRSLKLLLWDMAYCLNLL